MKLVNVPHTSWHMQILAIFKIDAKEVNHRKNYNVSTQ